MSSLLGLARPFLALNASESPIPSPCPLTNVQQVLALGLDGVRQGSMPVRLQGAITYADGATHMIYLQDSWAGIRVAYTNIDWPPACEQAVVVEGTATAGMFAPYIDCADVRVIGPGGMPQPCEAPAGRMAAGEFFGQWVQVQGVVRDVAKDPQSALLFVSSGGLRFHAVVQPFPGPGLPTNWLDARVALRGVCWTDVDAENKPTGFTLYVPGTNYLVFEDHGEEDIFRQPALPMDSSPELRRQSDVRVKVVGTVAFHSPGGYVYLQEQEGAVRARLLVPLARTGPQERHLARPPMIPLQPGERVELVGAPTAATFSPMLQDAEFRRVGQGPPPLAAPVSTSEVFAGKFDGRLVSLKGRLVASETRQQSNLKHQVLALQSGDTIFDALWEFTGSNSLPALVKNSYVRVTGICVLELGELNQIRSFRLLLREPADLQLLGRPPWWEPLPMGRIFTVAAGLGAAALVWIWLLRRQVVRRTAELQAEVSQRRRAQSELHDALTAERELNELRSRFVSLVSHEFRTPLGVILSAAENLDAYFERLNCEQRRTQLGHVIQATRQMAKVMENVLFIGRAEAGKLEFKPGTLDLACFCESIVRQIESSNKMDCSIHFRAGVLPPAHGDENLIRHILINLLTNALKYSRQGPAIEFAVERHDGEAIFRVQDHGIGIPVADQKQLFSAFHRGGNVGHIPGTGLGLVIVKRCVELHGGQILCQSSEGQGTTFEVKLPLFGTS